MNIGVFLPNWVGDLVMATPALRALRRGYPDAHLVGILRPHLVDVLAGTSWLDDTLCYDPRGNNPQQRGGAFVRGLRNQRLDVVVLLTNSLRTAWMAWLSGARRRVGYARNARGWMLTDRLRHAKVSGAWVPTPVMDDYLRLADRLGCPTDQRHLEVATLPPDEAAAGAIFDKFQFDQNDRPVALNCSGAFGAAKLWPVEYFAELAQRVVDHHQRDVLVVCGPAERDHAREIVRRADRPRVRSLAEERLSLGLTKACIRRSKVLVTTDSGPRHLGTALGVAIVTLFGPTHIAWSETFDPRAIHLQHKVPCGPCQQRVCPLVHHRCMRDLSVTRVFEAVTQQLISTAATPDAVPGPISCNDESRAA
jgi:heptosyltransferase-2